jgi:hypothetical protein
MALLRHKDRLRFASAAGPKADFVSPAGTILHANDPTLFNFHPSCIDSGNYP